MKPGADYKRQLSELQAAYNALVAVHGSLVTEHGILLADYADLKALNEVLAGANRDLSAENVALRIALDDCIEPPPPPPPPPPVEPLPLLAGIQVRNAEPGGPLVPNTERRWSDLHTGPGAFNAAGFEALLAKGPFRLRPMMGRYAPRWVMDAAGSFTYQEPVSGVLVEVVRWWEPAAMDAAAEFYDFLLAYDGDLPHVWGSSPMTFYPEPLQRGLKSAVTRTNLLAAGFDVGKDMVAHAAMIASLAAFKQTRVGVSYNPYQWLDPSGAWHVDPSVTLDLMTQLRTAAPAAVLHNCSFRDSFLASPATANGGVYGQMAALGGPRCIQTAMWSLVGDLRACITYLAGAGYHAVELPRGHDLTADEISGYDAALKANV